MNITRAFVKNHESFRLDLYGRKQGLYRVVIKGVDFLKTFYVDGIKHGLQTKFTYARRFHTFTMYENGIKIGPSKKVFENGNTYLVRYYKDGKLHGPYRRYDEDRILRHQCTFVGGQKQGEEHYYNRDGHITSYGIMKNGKYEGTFICFKNGGKAWCITEYKDGKECTDIFFKDDGEISIPIP